VAFIEEHRLWTDAQVRAAGEMERRIASEKLEVVRVAFADQHGLVRGKSLVAADAMKALRAGVRLVGTLLLKDTANRTAWPVFTAGGGLGSKDWEGAGDLVLVPDPTTFTVLPWAEKTGWVLCEAVFPDGRPVPFDTRALLRRALAGLADRGFDFLAGLEVEFHVFRLADARLASADATWPGRAPEVSLLHRGYQLLGEQRADEMDGALQILRRHVLAMGMPLRSVEIELGPSQCEFVFDVATGLAAADTMILFRNATKQIMRRHGLHATFMCRPALPNVMSSGWHLHQSLRERATGRNAFVPAEAIGPADAATRLLSPLGAHFLGGLLAHAAGYAAFATPTINGWRRYHRPASLAPDRVVWGADNRGALIRVIGGPRDPASRIENRIGEPAANPYLYLASQVFAGLDGIAHARDPGPSADAPYAVEAPRLPVSLDAALAALGSNDVMRAGFGSDFVDYFLRIKRQEIARFNAEVTAWEQDEYFDLY
jgi:glutamine synthetase